MSCYSNTYSWDPNVVNMNRAAETDDAKIAKYASLELAACRAENWKLKQKLMEYETTIRNLENMVTSIADKQQQILNELREENRKSPVLVSQLQGPSMPILENDDGEMGDDEGDDEILSQSSTVPSDLESEMDDSDDDEIHDDESAHSSDADSELN